MRSSLLVLGLLVSCSPSSPSSPSSPQAVPEGPSTQGPSQVEPRTESHGPSPKEPFRVEPRTEAMQNAGPVGRGNERCPLFVYPWDASAPGCQIGVTHCELKGDEQQCMSLADTRRVACGAKEDICGEGVRCACPAGAARPVKDAPGTVKLVAGGKGTTWKSPGCRAEEVAELPGIGKPPMPACLMLIHDCDAGQACDERMYTLSCGIRSDVCDKPVHCACP